jgi:CheY-like chemotaxis protein
MALVAAAGVDLARPVAEQKGVALHFTAPEDAVPLRGDPGRLQQMIGNLLSNAIKFTPRGGRVEVAVSRTAGNAVVVVRDSGEGIAGDVLPHIFERFRQADSQTTRAHGGLGLGLAIVRHLAEAHGGTAQAASAGPGRGASFHVTLPLAEGPAPQEVAPPRAASHDLAGVHVLLVDDDTDSAEPLALALGEQGALVAQAASVAEALARLEREPFDILVSDLGMPGESGLSLVRRLRAREAPGAPRLPAIALTGFASREDRATALAAGFDDHLAKPVDVEVLMTRLSRAVRGRSTPSDEPADGAEPGPLPVRL